MHRAIFAPVPDYDDAMARYVIDVPTLLHLLDSDLLGDRLSRGTAWRIAREHDWETLRDAEYLAVARLQADALVTMDAGLAAKAENVVAVAPLEALLADE
jgi:predicted nucleic acid-binding protein